MFNEVKWMQNPDRQDRRKPDMDTEHTADPAKNTQTDT